MPAARLQFVEKAPPLSKRDLRALERRIGTRLPKDYTDFLTVHNGAQPEPNMCDLPNAQRIGVGVTYFYGVGWEKADIIHAMDVYAGRIPSDYVPVAEAEGGNLVCLSLRKREYGSMYFWDHEREADDGEAPRADNLHLLAESFSDFLAHLRPLSAQDLHDGPQQVRSAWIDPEFLK